MTDYTQYAAAALALAAWYAFEYWPVILLLAVVGVIGMAAAAFNSGSKKTP
ncbi:hypothetical protein ACQR16_35905 [Bradyrhizobium oligotrophicum]|uniref:hypothetical protein n=1 Tax=Bradyrhizobium oligotrophicum TaxID=44255 RepID=UPI003EB7390D